METERQGEVAFGVILLIVFYSEELQHQEAVMIWWIIYLTINKLCTTLSSSTHSLACTSTSVTTRKDPSTSFSITNSSSSTHAQPISLSCASPCLFSTSKYSISCSRFQAKVASSTIKCPISSIILYFIRLSFISSSSVSIFLFQP